MILLAVGNIVWCGYPVILGRTLPYPSIADALVFASYAALALGLVLIIGARSDALDRFGPLVDSAIITVVAGFITWLHVLGPTAGTSVQSGMQRAVSLTYPLSDLAFLALLARMIFTRGAKRSAFWLLCAFVIAQLVGDTVFALSLLRGTFAYGQTWVSAWIIAYSCMAGAALHPSMRHVGSAAVTSTRPHRPMIRLVVVQVAALVVPVLAVIDRRATPGLVLGAGVTLFLLSGLRMALLVRQVHAHAMVIEGREQELRSTAERLHESEDVLVRQANYDALTGLPNRALFLDRLGAAVARPDTSVAVMLLDLDAFKTVNDSLGHAAGDALLVKVVERLTIGLRGADLLARLGGDEFTILAEGVDADGAIEIATRLVAMLHAPITIGTSTVSCKASIGISVGSSVSGKASHTSAELLRDADAAMYAAKRRGGQRDELCTDDMHARALNRLALESDLRAVVPEQDLTVHYQPVVDLTDGELSGFEALLRWNHPDRGAISPAEFIPIAEETGAILPIGRWVLSESCRQIRTWQQAYPHAAELGISVNVSARQLEDAELVADVARVLDESGLEPSLLTLEITETMVMANEDEALECVKQLKDLGVRISVDDFGTGYSSLAQLNRFPVDELKIDRSFVASLGSHGEGSGVAAAAIRLARSLLIDVGA